MPSDLWVMESANIFCGDVDPSRSQHLTITSVKLPNMEEKYVDHEAGGASHAIEVEMIMNKMQAPFKLAGWSPEVASLVGSWLQADNTYTVYGVVKDRRAGLDLEAKAIIGGRLGKADPDEWSRGSLQHWSYEIRGLTHYELFLDGQEIYAWDFYLNLWRSGGEDRNASRNQILRIPVTTAIS